MGRKIEEINNGLHGIETMLQQKSKNIEDAQEIQKVMGSLQGLQRVVVCLATVPSSQMRMHQA